MLSVLALCLIPAVAPWAWGCDCRTDRTPGEDAGEPTAAAADTPGSSSAATPPEASTAPPASATPERAADELTIVAGGDVNLGRGVGQQLWRGESVEVFREIGPVLRSADLRFVNLESQLSDQDGETQSTRNRLVFTGPPQGADLLARAGIDVVSLANNHMWDYGGKALFETIANLRRAGVAHVGASDQRGHQYEPLVVEKNGWSVAWFAVTHIWNQGPFQEHRGQDYVAWARMDILGPKIKEARQRHDVVLVSYHGGGEYLNEPMGWTREFVRAVMNAGADAVLGHHPHVPHGVGWFGDRPAFYSLGNLVFHMHRDYPWTGTSFLARLTFRRAEAGNKVQVEACPYHILGVTPMRFEGKTREPREQAFRQHLARVSMTVGGTQIGEPREHSCMLLSPPEKRRPKPSSGSRRTGNAQGG